jgi:hypothetical protein
MFDLPTEFENLFFTEITSSQVGYSLSQEFWLTDLCDQVSASSSNTSIIQTSIVVLYHTDTDEQLVRITPTYS